MRKRVFGSIFLTSLVTLLLTTGLLLLAVHAGLTNDMRQRLVTESSYLSAVDNIRGGAGEVRLGICRPFDAGRAGRHGAVRQPHGMPPRWRTTPFVRRLRRQSRTARARTTVCPETFAKADVLLRGCA